MTSAEVMRSGSPISAPGEAPPAFDIETIMATEAFELRVVDVPPTRPR